MLRLQLSARRRSPRSQAAPRGSELLLGTSLRSSHPSHERSREGNRTSLVPLAPSKPSVLNSPSAHSYTGKTLYFFPDPLFGSNPSRERNNSLAPAHTQRNQKHPEGCFAGCAQGGIRTPVARKGATFTASCIWPLYHLRKKLTCLKSYPYEIPLSAIRYLAEAERDYIYSRVHVHLFLFFIFLALDLSFIPHNLLKVKRLICAISRFNLFERLRHHVVDFEKNHPQLP